MPGSSSLIDSTSRPPNPALIQLREVLLLATILLVALSIRVFRLSDEDAWFDEISTLQHLNTDSLFVFLEKCYKLNPVPPAYLIVQFYWGKLAGTDVLAQRQLSVLFGMGSLLVLYGLSRSLFGMRTALITVAWTSLLPWHIYYSQEIRFYGLVCLLTLCSMWLFAYSTASLSLWGLALLCIVNWLLAWTHPLSVFLFGSQGLFLLIFRRQWTRGITLWLLAQLVTGYSLSRFLAGLDWDQVDGLSRWIPKPRVFGNNPSLESFFRVACGSSSANSYPEPFPFTAMGHALLPIYPVLAWGLIGVALIGMYTCLHSSISTNHTERMDCGTGRLSEAEKATLLFSWLILPPVFTFVVSIYWRPVFLDRYLLYAMIPICIFIGRAISLRRSWIAGVAAFSFPLVLYFAFYFPGPNRIPYRRIIETIQSHNGKNPALMATQGYFASAIVFYRNGFKLDLSNWNSLSSVVNGRIPPPEECWLVMTGHEYPHVTSALESRGEQYETWSFPSVNPVRLVYWEPKSERLDPLPPVELPDSSTAIDPK